MKNNEDIEKQIFEKFISKLNDANLYKDIIQFDKNQPSKPDVRYMRNNLYEFCELTELLHREWIHNKKKLDLFENQIIKYIKSNIKIHQTINKIYSGYTLLIFTKSKNFTERNYIKIIPKIINYLLNLNNLINNKDYYINDQIFIKIYEDKYSDDETPQILVDKTNSYILNNFVEKRITEKFSKQYDIDKNSKINLLLFCSTDYDFQEEWIDGIYEFIEQRIKKSQFSKVYFYSIPKDIRICLYE